jgi:hypothetical protein
MSDLPAPPFCPLEGVVGHAEVCPGAACPFWDEAIPPAGRCAVTELDLAGRPEIAAWLLRIRDQLETARTRLDRDEAREELYRLLATGDADGG